MRRKKPKAGEDGQSSLDAFSSTPLVDDQSDVPEMLDLDLMEAAEQQLNKESNPASHQQDEMKSFQMPSVTAQGHAQSPQTNIEYHNLGDLYPYAPVPLMHGELVLHYASLLDYTGTERISDWVSDGHAVIVDMSQIMSRSTEFSTSISALHHFIEKDMKGQIIRLNQDRLLVLPPGVRGVDGIEMEPFAVDHDDFTEV